MNNFEQGVRVLVVLRFNKEKVEIWLCFNNDEKNAGLGKILSCAKNHGKIAGL